MDTGENRLNAEMMKKLYEAYKLDTKEKIDKFNEAARKIISDKEYPEAEDILKLVEGTPITDNHERRIHDPSIYKYRGKQVLNPFFDEPYPVMMPEDVETMKGVWEEFIKKFREYVSKERSEPRPTITIDSIPDNVREEAEREALLYGDCYVAGYSVEWINGINAKDELRGFSHPVVFDEDGYLMTGATQNFKQQQSCDKLEALYDILDNEATDRNGSIGSIWKREFMKKVLNNQIYLTAPRGHKSWLWLKLLELQKSYEVNLVQTLETPPSTKVDLKSVIHMKWPKQDLSDLKAHDFRYGKMWHDQALINYAAGDVSHIDMMIYGSLAAFGPDINSGYGLSTPNLNDIDKKKLERVIKRRKRK